MLFQQDCLVSEMLQWETHLSIVLCNHLFIAAGWYLIGSLDGIQKKHLGWYQITRMRWDMHRVCFLVVQVSWYWLNWLAILGLEVRLLQDLVALVLMDSVFLCFLEIKVHLPAVRLPLESLKYKSRVDLPLQGLHSMGQYKPVFYIVLYGWWCYKSKNPIWDGRTMFPHNSDVRWAKLFHRTLLQP